MQLRGFTKVFTVVLVLISIYQLHFTFVVKRHEQKLEALAALRSEKDSAVHTPEQKALSIKRNYRRLLDSSKEAVLTYGFEGAVTYAKAKEQELNLGLDLQGGMNVTLDVDLGEMVRSMANDAKNPLLNQAIALADKQKHLRGGDYATLLAQAFKEVSAETPLYRYFSNFVKKTKSTQQDDAAVVALIRKEASEALKRTYDILLTRIDQFGVAQPTMNLDAEKGIITVELAGNQEDPERIRKYLQATAKLQFWEVGTVAGGLDALLNAQQALAAYLSQEVKSGEKKPTEKAQKTQKTAEAKTSVEALLDYTEAQNQSDAESQKDVKQVNVFTHILAQIQYYIESNAKKDITPEHMPFIFQLPGSEAAAFKEYMQLDFIREIFPENLLFLPGVAEEGDARDVTTFYAIKTDEQTNQAPLEGDNVADAAQDFDERGRAAIRMVMTPVGERIWADLTAENVGKPIAITLDDKVYSAPVVNAPITGGVSQITGSFSVQAAQDLATILRSGKLPAPAKILQEQIVGPTLGKEAIIGGAKAFIISFAAIIFFMFLYYNAAGSIANFALILNLLFTVGVLSALGATLTAPGIAGLVLTIGMAVDTNVIIFERIKEEIKRGVGYLSAIKIGYRRSLAPVLDAHITTLLTAIILYNFGIGPIKGFATTQILGILLSLLCGILISRQMSDFCVSRGRSLNYFTAISRRLFQQAHFRFIEFRKITYVISGCIVLLGIGTFFYGFDAGVEFKGGRSYTIRLGGVPNVEEIRRDLKEALGGDNPIIKTIGDNQTLNITTSYLIEQTDATTDSLVERRLFTALQKHLPDGLSLERFLSVHKLSSVTMLPVISEDLKKGAIKATILSFIAIFVYIFIRFRKWQYSFGTLVALLHDVLVMLIVFSFLRKIVPFPLEIDQHFVAALLTVIGFSMNDTVIVFDRIRETYKLMPAAGDIQVINKAINDTLSRTVMTAFTVFMVILILFLFGGETTRGFAFALLMGVLVGTYSSIFVAAPVLVDLQRIKKKAKKSS